MERRKFTREFKLEAVRLITDRGVSYAQAEQDLDVHLAAAGFDLPLDFYPAAIRASAKMLRDRTLDRRRVEFSGSVTKAGWLRRRDLAS